MGGGVLEHPRASRLWPEYGLPLGPVRDGWGGFTLDVNQSWWGHAAAKRSLFYICGIEPRDVPLIPMSLALPPKLVCSALGRGRPRRRGTYLPKSQREHTPPLLAVWLLELARRVAKP